MRTTKTLMGNSVYVNGQSSFVGDVDRLYTSAVIVTLQVHVVKAPLGAQVEYTASDDLVQVIKKLKPGQIGALKETDEDEGIVSSESFLEIIIPTSQDNTIAVAEACRALTKSADVTDGMTVTVEGTPIPVSTLKERLVSRRDQNREIQKRWIEFVKTDRAKSLSSAQKLEQKERIYSEYFSLTEYNLTVTGKIRHVVNNPELGSVVIANADMIYYNRVNYTEGNIRVKKWAADRLQVVSIPVITREDYRDSLLRLKGMLKKSKLVKELKTKGGEEVYHEGGAFGNNSIDWDDLRSRDSKARLGIQG